MANDEVTERTSPADGLLLRHRFVWLFALLLAFFLVLPIVQALRAIVHFEKPHILEPGTFIVVVALVVLSISESRAAKLFTVLLSVPTIVLWVLPAEGIADSVAILRHVLALGFLGFAIVRIFGVILQASEVNLNLLCASLCVYLLLGILWAVGYSLIVIITPNAYFASLPEAAAPGAMRMDAGHPAEVLYFSFITLTTLGYGDIVPISPMTRMLAALEALVGQLFLAVLVSRLVGLHIVDEQNRQAA